MKQQYIVPNLKMIALSSRAHYMTVTSGGSYWSTIDPVGGSVSE